MPTANLTDAFVKAFKCEADKPLSEIRDEDVHGLELRAWVSGAKRWRLHYTRRSDGKRRAIGLGAYPALSLKEARVKAKRLQAGIEDEETKLDPAAERQVRKAANTFSEIADEWIERHGKPNKGRRVLRADQYMLDRHIRPAIGAMKAAEITKRDVIRLFDDVANKPDARSKNAKVQRKLTHLPNRVFALVRSIFRWAVGRDLLKIDPTWGMGPPIKKEKPRERDLSTKEIATLWAALDRAPAQRRTTKGLPRGERIVGATDIPLTRATALTLKLALLTAQRIGEVAGIAMAELDLNDTAPMWTVPGDRSKNGQANRVPLSPLAVQIIREALALIPEHEALEGDGPDRELQQPKWLFPSPSGDGPIDPHASTKALDRARPAIGLADFRIHDLRRTAATRMAEMGIAPHTISLVLNHVSARSGTITGKVYVQYSYDREKREALGAWGARLGRILAGTDGGNVVAIAR